MKTRKLMALVVATLTISLFSLERTALAQSPHNNPWIGLRAQRGTAEQSASAKSRDRDCIQARGDMIEVSPGTGLITTGTITQGGILNGTTETLFNPVFVFTPDPNVVSYIGDLTITTHRGQLKTSNVYLYDFATGLFTVLGRVNSSTSTGRFAGATGALYFNGKTIGNGLTYQQSITGEICFANE
jgi:hypothetical protein